MGERKLDEEDSLSIDPASSILSSLSLSKKQTQNP